MALGGRPLAVASGAAVARDLHASAAQRTPTGAPSASTSTSRCWSPTTRRPPTLAEARRPAARRASSCSARERVAAADLDVALAWASLVVDAWPTLTWRSARHRRRPAHGTAPRCAFRAQPPPRPATCCSTTASAASPPTARVRDPRRTGARRRDRRCRGSTSSPTSSFGFLVSESGAGYTWSRNSREHRLTPWRNDPVGDPHERSALPARRGRAADALVAAARAAAGAGAPTRCATASATREWRQQQPATSSRRSCSSCRGTTRVKITRVAPDQPRQRPPRRLSLVRLRAVWCSA